MHTAGSLIRWLRALRRPTGRANLRRLRRRGEDPRDLHIREAVPADIPALGRLHAETWHQTYGGFASPGSIGLRQRQWREAFADPAGWCAFVVVTPDGRLVGFAKGRRTTSLEVGEFDGELNKIYLLREYQRLGLGRQLLHRVAERLAADGVHAMLAFTDPTNPSGGWFSAMGAQRQPGPDGSPSGGTYGWPELHSLLAATPPPPADFS